MNTKQIAEQLNATVEEVREAAKVLFTPTPPTFDQFQVNQIKNYLNGPNPKKLNQSNNLTNQASSKVSNLDTSSESLNPYSKERSSDRIKKLIQSAQLAGQSEAELYSAIKNDSFHKHTSASDDEIFNDFIRGVIAHSIQSKHAANHAEKINSIDSIEEINIEAIEIEKTDWKQLQSSEQDIINRGFQKLLGEG